MARIAGIDIPREKRVEIALTYIYGIGLPTSQKILLQTNINPDTRVRDLTEDQVNRLREVIDRRYKVEGDLRREVALNIKRLIEIGSSLLLLAPGADGLLGTASLASIGLRPLAADREVPPMAEAAVRADLDEALDVQGHFPAEVALHLVAAVDHLPQPVDLVLGEVPDPGVGVDVRLLEDLLARGEPDPVDIGEGDLHALLARDVDAGDPCHSSSPAAACASGWRR